MLVIKLTNADVREVHRIRQCHVDSSWSSRSRKVLSVKPVVTEICGFIVVQVRVVQVLGYAVRQFAPQSHKKHGSSGTTVVEMQENSWGNYCSLFENTAVCQCLLWCF